MGALLLSLFGSLGIISSGAGTVAGATTIPAGTYVINASASSMIDLVSKEVSGILNADSTWILTIEKAIYVGEKATADIVADAMIALEEAASLTTEVLSNEAALATAAEALSTTTAVEGGILAGSLGTAVQTLGISLAIGAAIYGGYYTYQHWDSVKHFASEALTTTGHYVSSATDYLKGWWSF
ncbi:hypothetical protein [Spiroplasma poulsonii]|uniref:Uncharacterized protein n=1 Tax=Spiroplasma poulsonii TaxID=2138 RepID=A0A2P6FE49_9MOLU|nr:hypothetical protein [Spiroplasma poulsonii]KAF0850721.1 membrane protein [Spiroplasma poulsonii]PQM31731.1 hypothetical protein SMSRO_SF015820 [Spiroplasma poulsonii]PWF96762.1 hypothetical protein SMSE_22090 [Spiroplasma poulsonii]PWF97337.1 hypothetical protein SMH99_21460 [Spiroplasma poulsonii]